MSRFQDLKPNQNFVTLEKEILHYWNAHRVFEKTLQNLTDKPTFCFYDGPPFATGLPHYGHILTGVIKDAFCRFKTMQGFVVPRKFGWDCHGLPVEMEVQTSKNLPTSKEIESFGIKNFNLACRGIVDKYTDEWKSIVTRSGRWIDMDNPYRTMDLSFMESVWWCFAQLMQKNLVYQGFKILPYSWKAGTSLSNFEANLNYKSVQDPAITVRFPLTNDLQTSFLAWTTTPWTIPSHRALCVHPQKVYVCVQDDVSNQRYILAKDCLDNVFASQKNALPRIQRTFLGLELAKQTYIPPYDWGAKDGFIPHVVIDDYVSTQDGTGIVHQAPAHGEDDYRICCANDIPYLDLLDSTGCFIQNLGELSGLLFRDANKLIIKHLKQKSLLFHLSTIEHSYPHCWRTDAPLLYKGISTWFVRVESFKNDLIKNNQLINWTPKHIKDGRFGKWLQNAKDWDIGRNRFWGTPIPIWKSSQGDLICISSVQELESLSGEKIHDLHRHNIDNIVLHKNGISYTRIPQVLDCWFESGAMPYAQLHYPFENKLFGDTQFPAHFIAEGLDQTRGWFYTLLVLSTALQNKPPVQNILVTGLILAEDGQKMSKRLKNYPEPLVILDSHGADALRLYLFASGATRGESLKFSAEGVQDTLRSVILPLWNALYFFTTYANIDGFSPLTSPNITQHWVDRWMLSLSQLFIRDMTQALDLYDLQSASSSLSTFVDKLTNGYIRLNRRRFWKEESDPDKWAAYHTLFQVLQTTCLVIAPIVPFLSEKMFHILQRSNAESIHTKDFPVFQLNLVDQNLVDTMDLLDDVVKMGRSLRSSAKIKNRQPLALATLICTDTKKCLELQKLQALLQDELNLKNVIFSTQKSTLINYSAKPNLPLLGKRWGRYLPQIREKIGQLSQDELALIKQGSFIPFPLAEDQDFYLSCENVLLEHSVKQSLCADQLGEITLILDTHISPELYQECVARELVNRIQKQRKILDLPFEKFIHVLVSPIPLWQSAFDAHREYILQETLCSHLRFEQNQGTPIDVEGNLGFLSIQSL